MNLHAPTLDHYAADIRAMLDRVNASAEFRSSPQLVAFLRLVVEMTLRGEADRIKAYIIGTDAFGRGPDFNPQRDPIVRVEANRLRRTLAAYYAAAGAQDPIIIEIPPGRYVPSFRLRTGDESAATPPEPEETIAKVRPWRLPGWGAAIVTIVLLGVGTAALWWSRPALKEAEPPFVRVGQVEGGPVILIEPIQAMPASASSLATALNAELVRAAINFPTVTIVSGNARTDERVGTGPIYRLTGFVEKLAAGRADVTLQLVSDGVIAWTHNWSIAADGAPSPEMISREATTELVSAFGVIHARLRGQTSRLSPGFRCMLAAADYLRKFDLTQHDTIRTCLEETIVESPGAAVAFAILAFVYEREYFVDRPARPGDAPALERARKASERALALKPDHAVVQLAAMESAYVRGDLAAAYAAGERAIALNPLDPSFAGVMGLRLLLGGEVARGTALLEKASANYGVKPTWLAFGLFCVAYLKGDMTDAAHYANLQVTDTYPFGMVARALVAAKAGDLDGARRTLVRLATIYPSWSDPNLMLARFIKSRDIADRFGRDIETIMGR